MFLITLNGKKEFIKTLNTVFNMCDLEINIGEFGNGYKETEKQVNVQIIL